MKNIKSVNLGPVVQIPVGQGRQYVINEQAVAIFRTREGKIFAIEDACPHRKGPLSEGIIGDGKVICPLHGHKFDLETGQGSEGHECVRQFKVCQENDTIVIEWPSEN